MPGRIYIDPSQDDLDNKVDQQDYFAFTSSHPHGPKVAGLVVYEPRGSNGFRHSRFFKTFKQAQNEYMFADDQIIRPPKNRLTVY